MLSMSTQRIQLVIRNLDKLRQALRKAQGWKSKTGKLQERMWRAWWSVRNVALCSSKCIGLPIDCILKRVCQCLTHILDVSHLGFGSLEAKLPGDRRCDKTYKPLPNNGPDSDSASEASIPLIVFDERGDEVVISQKVSVRQFKRACQSC